MKLVIRLYRLLADAFPHEFKVAYGTDFVQLGEDVLDEVARQNGFWGLVRMVADVAMRVPIEYLSEIRRDLGYALRTLLHSPGFVAVCVLSLGLGMGVASVAYTEVHALFFRPLPLVTDPERLVTMEASYPYFEQYREQRDVVSAAAAYMMGVPISITLDSASGAKAERIFGQIVSPEYFQVMGISAGRGRVFSPDVDRPGSAPVVVVTDRFWREH